MLTGGDGDVLKCRAVGINRAPVDARGVAVVDVAGVHQELLTSPTRQ
jgi:hypothetical protein